MSAPEAFSFGPGDQPAFPGSPYAPLHPLGRRAGYVAVAALFAIVASLGNAVVTVNVPSLAGALGIDTAQAYLLPAAYVAVNGFANLLLPRARQQFGIPPVTILLLGAYTAAAVVQLLIPGFAAALLVRAVSGMCAAGLTTVAAGNLLQVAPRSNRVLALVGTVSLLQFSTPLARFVPVELFAQDHWLSLRLLELALPLAALAAMFALPLPPSDRTPAFEPLDFLTMGLFAPAMLLLCAVLGVGRFVWWTDTPWLGVALCGALTLFVGVFLVEHNRARPLLQTRWLATRDIARFVLLMALVRLALTEQTYGAVGLLSVAGLTNDQLHVLFVAVMAAMAAAAVVTVRLISPRRTAFLLIVACLLLAMGAWLDSHASNLTRPGQLILSQTLIGGGSILFLGPAVAYGAAQTLQNAPERLVTFLVSFNITQNLGGLAGSALLGSYQVAAARAHALALAETVRGSDPQAAAQIQNGSSGLIVALNREANILAFNDVFRAVAILALLTGGYVAYIRVFNVLRQRRLATTS